MKVVNKRTGAQVFGICTLNSLNNKFLRKIVCLYLVEFLFMAPVVTPVN
jgi:hypothetical protein